MPLIQNQPVQPGQPAQDPGAQAAPGAQAPESGGAVSPEDQQAYERVVLAGMKVIHGDKTHKEVMQALQSGASEPSEALADVVAFVILQIDEKSGGKIPEAVILPAAEELLTEVAELAQKSGVFQVDDKVVGVAMQRVVASLGEAYGVSEQDAKGLMDSVGPEQAKQLADEQQALNQGAPGQGAPQAAAGAAPAQAGATQPQGV